MFSFGFWQKWLFAVGMLMVIFGLGLAFFNDTAVFSLFDQNIHPAFWQGDPPPAPFLSFQRWIYAVLGATMAGWGVCISFMTSYPFRRKERWVWNALACGILLWAAVDTFYSLYFRVFFNVLFNLVILIAAALPLLFTYREFRSAQA